jgi:Fe-S-cluster-containing dehydrogenase component
VAEQPREAWFESPLLRVLDARGRADVRTAGTLRRLAPGAVAFVPGDPADTLWFIGSGSVALISSSSERRLGPREFFGTEALVRGEARSARACVAAESSLFEVPVSALRRVLGRAGAEATLARAEAHARRQAFSSLLAETPLGQGLTESELTALTAELREERREGGESLCVEGAPARAAFLVARGLVELGSKAAPGYAARGDIVGLEALLRGEAHAERATALGDVLVLALPASSLRELARRNHPAVQRQQERDRARSAKQKRVHELARARATRHAFHELERLESARSLLAIELDSCVRCGHCAWACAEAHGTSRLERRGDRAMLALPDASGALATRALLFPQACQHCKDPVCLVECPTGAIGREADGAVLLRDDLCTGCGACAKACPWDAIRMAPRGATAEPGASALLATKCDLCRDGDSPECVSACPTGAMFRAEPERDFVELRGALGVGEKPAVSNAPAPWTPARVVLLAATLPPLVALAAVGAAGERWRGVAGVLACVLSLLAGAHVLVKRVRPVRAWLRVRVLPALRRGLRPLVVAHSLLGLAAALLVLVHTRGRVPHSASGALALSFWLLAALGVLGAIAYRVVPARLSRLERRGTLPEDHPAELEGLNQQLFSGLSDQNPALKELARRVLVPYARASLGGLLLVLSGRTLAAEEAKLVARVHGLLRGQKSARLTGAETLIGTAVAIRALAARRLLERALGAWLPAHQLLAILFGALLLLHLVAVLR